jgi:signal transduction histidine kinase
MILLSNATKYSPAGAEVMVIGRMNNGSVEVTVKDQGPGMPADFDNSLFTGAQGVNSNNHLNRGMGAGLGLQIARQIVEMHSGRIWFENSASRGAEFHFTLPMRVRRPQELRTVARSR